MYYVQVSDYSKPHVARSPTSAGSASPGQDSRLTLSRRIRKVKCDEARPACNRCTKAGRTCDGYRDSTPPTTGGKALAIRSTGHASTGHASTSSSLESVRVSLPSWMAGADPRETTAFDFYVRRVAPVLAGEFDSHFWEVLVPRLCQSEPAIRHAVFSLGAVYRAVDESGMSMPPLPGDPATTFPVAAYNRAISALLSLDTGRTSGQEPTVIYLLTCILFVCIEFLFGNIRSSHSHINQGRQILARLDEASARHSSPQMEMIRRNLVPIYSRLALTSFTWGQDPVAIPPRMNLHGEVPAEFGSTDDARASLYSAIDDTLRASKKVRMVKYEGMMGDVEEEDLQAVQREHQGLLSHLKSWNVAFTLYIANRSAAGGRQCLSSGEKVMSMYYHVAYIWVSNSFSLLETSYDDYMEHFTSIVSLASSMQGTTSTGSHGVARSTSQGASSIDTPEAAASLVSNDTGGSASPSRESAPRGSTAFSFHDNVIPPLYYTALRCRHPRLRRTALALLENLARVSPREALWDARYLAPVAKRVMELEGSESPEPGAASSSGGSAWDVSAEPNMQAASGGSYLHPHSTFGIAGISPGAGRNTPRGHEPPFGVPDEVRVRELLIGGKDDQRKDPNGTWITILRKPLGVENDWDIQREWIPIRT